MGNIYTVLILLVYPFSHKIMYYHLQLLKLYIRINYF